MGGAIGFGQLLIILAIALVVWRMRGAAARQNPPQQKGSHSTAQAQALPWWRNPFRIILLLLVSVIVVTNAVALWMKWG